jgi:ABC-type branched-subunit amino acid transport system permease subunit
MPQNQSKRMLAFVLSGIVLAVLPFIVGSTLGNSWVRTLDFALLYIMLALGLNIVVGFAGLLDLGYIAFYAVGAYTFALLNSPHLSIFMPWWFILPLGAILAAFFGIAWILIRFTDSNVPWLDSFTTALSIIGMWMLARKYVEQWWAWIVVDVVCCGLYIYKELYFTSALYGLYSIIAIFGYFKWKQMM